MTKISFGSMVLKSDGLQECQQSVEVFFLSAIPEHCAKVSVEQRLIKDGLVSAPTSFRFSSSGQLRAFLADVLLPAYLYFSESEGKQRGFVLDDLQKISYGLRDFERCGGR